MAAAVIAGPKARSNSRLAQISKARTPDVAASKDLPVRDSDTPNNRRSGGCAKMVRD